MVTLSDKVAPYLEGFREILFKGSDMLAGAFELDPINTYSIVMLILSIVLAKGILEFFYTNLNGRKFYWVILTGVLYFILKIFGA